MHVDAMAVWRKEVIAEDQKSKDALSHKVASDSLFLWLEDQNVEPTLNMLIRRIGVFWPSNVRNPPSEAAVAANEQKLSLKTVLNIKLGDVKPIKVKALYDYFQKYHPSTKELPTPVAKLEIIKTFCNEARTDDYQQGAQIRVSHTIIFKVPIAPVRVATAPKVQKNKDTDSALAVALDTSDVRNTSIWSTFFGPLHSSG